MFLLCTSSCSSSCDFICISRLLTHGIIPFSPAYRDPLIYNLSVTRELLKQVYIAERLQPPTSLSTIRSAYSTLWARASNPAYWREIAQSGELARVGVYAVEAYGIFKVRTVLEVFLTHFHLTNFFWFWFPALDWGDRRTKESCWV